MLEILSDIYYRMNFCDVIMSGGASIASKIAVQVDARRDARSFWWGGRAKSRLVSLFSDARASMYWNPRATQVLLLLAQTKLRPAHPWLRLKWPLLTFRD
jgi:hypothetical protein